MIQPVEMREQVRLRGQDNTGTVHTPHRARYVIFYFAPAVPKNIKSGFFTLKDCCKYALAHLDNKPAYIWDREVNKMVYEFQYPNGGIKDEML